MGLFRGFDGLDDMLRSFDAVTAPIRPRAESDVLIATYEQEDYEGSAFVLFTDGGRLFEVNGSHCSCYGLEDCWRPEETSWEALAIRRDLSGRDAREALQEQRKAEIAKARDRIVTVEARSARAIAISGPIGRITEGKNDG